MFFAAIALLAPIVEIIPVAPIYLVDIRRKRVRPVQRSFLVRLDSVSTGAPGGFSFAVVHHDQRAVPVFIGLEAVATRPQNRKRLVRSIHFEDFASFQPSHADGECTRG